MQVKALSIKESIYDLLINHLFGDNPQQQASRLRALQPYVVQLRRSFRANQLSVDYGNPAIRQAYLLAYYPLQTTQLFSLLRKLSGLKQHFQKNSLDIVLLGGGPAPEALAFLNYVHRSGLKPRQVNFYVLDAYDWTKEQQITEWLAQQLFPSIQSNLHWVKVDINQEMTSAPDCVRNADLVSLQYMLSDVEHHVRRIYLKNIDRLLSEMQRNTPLVITDSIRILQTNLLSLLNRNIEVNNHSVVYQADYLQDYVSQFVDYPRILLGNLLTGYDGLIPRRQNSYSALVALANVKTTQATEQVAAKLTVQRQQFLRKLAQLLHTREHFSVSVYPFISDDVAIDLVLFDIQSSAVISAEARDWVDIKLNDDGTLLVRESYDSEYCFSDDPLLIAEEASQELQATYSDYLRTLAAHHNLVETPMAWQAAVFLPNVPQKAIDSLVEQGYWPANVVIGREHFTKSGNVRSKLRCAYPPIACAPATVDHLQLVRGLINSAMIIKRLDQVVGVFTTDQAKLITEKIPALEKSIELPFSPLKQVPETSMLGNQHIRLIKGPAGSGKTLVLIERAKWIATRYPYARILVLCFNRMLLHDVLKPQLEGICSVNTFYQQAFDIGGYSRKKDQRKNISAWLIEWFPEEIKQLGLPPEFIAREFEWRWELKLGNTGYLTTDRRGRGQALNRRKREEINRLHAYYQEWKHQKQLYDWESDHRPALEKIRAGNVNFVPFDVILVDEGQDFAPSWVSLVRRMLKPDGHLMIAFDPNQSVFRNYTWKERGISASGIVRTLSVPFRSTRNINIAAHSLITDASLISDDADTKSTIELDKYTLPEGHLPEIYLCQTEDDAQSLCHDLMRQQKVDNNWSDMELARRIVVVTDQGVSRDKRLPDFEKCYKTFKQVKGVEFDAVIILQPEILFTDPDDAEITKAGIHWVHMAMTRARLRLILIVVGELPAPLAPLRSTCDVNEVGQH